MCGVILIWWKLHMGVKLWIVRVCVYKWCCETQKPSDIRNYPRGKSGISCQTDASRIGGGWARVLFAGLYTTCLKTNDSLNRGVILHSPLFTFCQNVQNHNFSLKNHGIWVLRLSRHNFNRLFASRGDHKLCEILFILLKNRGRWFRTRGEACSQKSACCTTMP